MLRLLLPAALAIVMSGPAFAGPPQYEDEKGAPDADMMGAVEQTDPVFERGEYLPIQFRGNFLTDWQDYGLREADPGFSWVQIGEKAYLINLTSGLITDTYTGIGD